MNATVQRVRDRYPSFWWSVMRMRVKFPARWQKLQEAVGATGVVLLVLFLATGCGSLVKEPPTTAVPVAVSCVKKRPVAPAFRTEAEMMQLDDYRAVLAFRAERLKATKYIGELEDVVTVCEQAPNTVTVIVPALKEPKK